jgi:hypothetical protein
MNIWDISFWAILVVAFFASLSIVLTSANWFFVLGLVVSTMAITYFLGEA